MDEANRPAVTDLRPPRPLRSSPTLPLLHTLGTLHLPGAAVSRPKPLVLLAYLAHEGPTDRERLARLFFGSSRDPRDALGTTLRRLGPLVAPAAASDGRVRARATTDALEFEHLAVAGTARVALDAYGGAFLEGAATRYGVEVEDWVLATREHCGALARDLGLELARSELADDRPAAAWRQARRALERTVRLGLDPEPCALLLAELRTAGLRVPEGWWRALDGLGFERSSDGSKAATARAREGDRRTHRGAERRPARRPGARAARHADARALPAGGLRVPRRRSERP